jgi:hypothetical protein
MMVVRVRVPRRIADRIKIYRVEGLEERRRFEVIHDLKILSAYLDAPGLPNVPLAD